MTPISGAPAAVRGLREQGHRLRFVTNSTTMSRAQLAEQLRQIGIELDDDELQTPGGVAARTLAGKRVLALTMPGLLDDLDGLQLVGMNVDAVLIGGADEGEETGRVFSYLNLNRAFHELEAGAELYCLHRNKWWQTANGPRLDAGMFVAGLEYVAGIEATVLGKPSPAFFAAALEALDADPELTWIVGDDLEGDIAGGRAHGLKTILVRTGKFRPDELEHSRDPARRHRVVGRAAAGLAREQPVSDAARVRVGVDLIEIERIRRALDRHGEGFKRRCFTDGERAYCDSKPNPPQHYAGRFAAKEAVGKAIGSGVYFTWKEIEIRGRPKPGVVPLRPHRRLGREGGGGEDRALDDALARARGCRGGRGRRDEARAAPHGRRDSRGRGGASRAR